MNRPETRSAWMWRAVVATLVGVGSGAAAHIMMGGTVPGILGVAPAAVITLLVGLLVLRRESVAGSLSTAMVGQWVFHELAVLGSPYVASAAHHHGAGSWQPTVFDELPMTTGHLVAAALTAASIVLAHRVRELMRRLRVVVGAWWSSRVQAVTPPIVMAPRRLRPVVVLRESSRDLIEQLGFGLRAPPSFSH